MMAALHNFTRINRSPTTYIKNYIIGKEIQRAHFSIKIPDDFQVPGLPTLNESQIQVIEKSLESRVSLIQGPPGTGKTVTIAAIVYYLVKYLNKKVLVCASSNKAVDNAYQKIEDTGLKVVRVIAKYRQREENIRKDNICLTRLQEDNINTECEISKIDKLTTDDKTIEDFGITHYSSSAADKIAGDENNMCDEDRCPSSDLKLDNGTGCPSSTQPPIDIQDPCQDLDSCGFAEYSPAMDSEQRVIRDYSYHQDEQSVNAVSITSPHRLLNTTSSTNPQKGYFNSDPASYKIDIKQDLSLMEAEVVCSTCSGAGDPRVFGLRFDCVLIDESTQSTEPQSLIPISLCKERLIMVGDHRQLGPVVKCKSASEKGLSLSLFDRLIKIGSIPYRLNEQYRMHPALSEFSSLAFYEGTVKSGVTIGMI
ncbi:Regulator of nonsense transcripts 1 [Thelohanellus kitauei]|uniref:Regulator of nonsense transcripts 1 n=1 Tax=Thelohanellus kitauei TaxID=669202 RepID=A0A0C2MPN5_THEKT|nr:Regulator of nonsense transcripts 1 [Thelohanellus kitauei]